MEHSQADFEQDTYHQQAHPKTNVLAIVSLVFGVLGVVFLGSIIAIICGHIARGQIRDSQGKQNGDAFAIVGLVLGYLMLGLTVLIVIGAFFFAGFMDTINNITL